MEKLKGSIFMTSKDIMVVNDCSESTAKREHRLVRDALGIPHSKLTVIQYANYWGISYESVVIKLNEYR